MYESFATNETSRSIVDGVNHKLLQLPAAGIREHGSNVRIVRIIEGRAYTQSLDPGLEDRYKLGVDSMEADDALNTNAVLPS